LIFRTADVKVLVRELSQSEIITMNVDQKQEEWFKLCEQAAVEQDPEKLVALTREICRLLDERQKRLQNTEA
jgi:hypothetical protein